MTVHAPFPARSRAESLLARMQGARIAVVGDVMLDRYLIGDTDRLSPEAPVPVVNVASQRAALGGAANVAANVTAIGARCHLVGVVGRDGPADLIREAMRAARLADDHLLALDGRPTTSKTRVIARGQQVVRIDEEVAADLRGADEEALAALAEAAVASADALLLEDYNKGALTPRVIERSIRAARARQLPVVVDPKFRNFFGYAGTTVFKPNRRELEAALGATVSLDDHDALPHLLARLGVENLLLTLGPEGMVLVTGTGQTVRIPSIARAVFDVSGAGDTVTAWVGTALAAGATLVEAAQFATYAAGIEVGKPGVAVVTPEEVLAEAFG